MLKKTVLSLIFCAMMSSAAAQHTFREVDYTEKQTTFILNAPSTATPVVKIFSTNDSEKPETVVKMTRIGQDRWGASVKKNLLGKFYAFNIDGKNGDTKKDTPGVFAKAVGVNGKRAAIVSHEQTNVFGVQKDSEYTPTALAPQDWVIYEMHHRDFSIDPSSGIPVAHRGKYLALTYEKSINHLKALGVNAVHILPSYDYASVDETKLDTPQYNWGYDPLNYNVPEGSYSTDPYNPVTRIREFKEMVKALHDAGIKVILDVVYNHTFDIENSNFHKTYPRYYYRYNADGTPSDGSACGNETASEKPLMRQFMIESMKYWVDEYHIDGFRVDLMGIHDIETMNAIKDALPKEVFIYGEGWNAAQCAYPTEKLALKAHTSQMRGIAAFSDEIRDALRGPFSDDTQGAFLAGLGGHKESLKFGIVGAIKHDGVDMSQVNYSKEAWAAQPTQMISYVSCHDDMCLVDRLKASVPNITEDELIRLNLLAQTVVFTSQGVPFMLSGEEMFRDKKGVHNSYKSPDDINRLDWNNLNRYPQVFEYYSRLINLRKNHPAFRMGKANLVQKHLSFLDVEDSQVLAFRLNGDAVGDSWKDIIVVFNSNAEEIEFALPKDAQIRNEVQYVDGERREVEYAGKTYTIVCANGKIDENGLDTTQGNLVRVAPQSALILKR